MTHTTDTTTRALAVALAELAELGPYALAGLAECQSPDAHDSAGAVFLANVRDAVADAFTYAAECDADPDTLGADDHGDALAELADGAPSVYTFPAWQTFTDLGAWQEYADDGDGYADAAAEYLRAGESWRVAAIALYAVAERLARALWEQCAETYAAELAADDDDDTTDRN